MLSSQLNIRVLLPWKMGKLDSGEQLIVYKDELKEEREQNRNRIQQSQDIWLHM
jgi:hypothetical protein